MTEGIAFKLVNGLYLSFPLCDQDIDEFIEAEDTPITEEDLAEFRLKVLERIDWCQKITDQSLVKTVVDRMETRVQTLISILKEFDKRFPL